MSDNGVKLRCRIRAYDSNVSEFEIFTDGLATLTVNEAGGDPPILDIPPEEVELDLDGGFIDMVIYNTGGFATNWLLANEESWMAIDDNGIFTWTNEVEETDSGAVTVTATNVSGPDNSILNWTGERQPPIWQEIDDVTIFSSEAPTYSRDMNEFVVSQDNDLDADWTIEEGDLDGTPVYGYEDISLRGSEYGDLVPSGTIVGLATIDNASNETLLFDSAHPSGFQPPRTITAFGQDWIFTWNESFDDGWDIVSAELRALVVGANNTTIPITIQNPESDLEGWTTTNGAITQIGIWTPETSTPSTITSQQTVTNDVGTTQGNEWDLVILDEGYFHNFTLGDDEGKLTLGGFTHSRASERDITDYRDQIITVPEETPAFYGGRYDDVDDEWYAEPQTRGLMANHEDLPIAETRIEGFIPDMDPDLGTLVNDFCVQVVMQLTVDYVDLGAAPYFLTMNQTFVGGPGNINQTQVSIGKSTDDRASVAVRRDFDTSSNLTHRQQGALLPVAGDVIDIRMRISSTTGVTSWILLQDGNFDRQDNALDIEDFAASLEYITLGQRYVNSSELHISEGVIRAVKIVNEELDDETILGWSSYDPLPAFPGAEGFGMYAIGGRGGQVIEVTNLDNDGPGSLREALNTTGPRNIVFTISGIIEYTDRGQSIGEGYCSVWGQTAPSPGITIKGTPLVIHAPHVIVQHIKSRPGDTGTQVNNRDCLGVETFFPWNGIPVNNVICSHMSLSWGTDANIDIYNGEDEIWRCFNVTIQDCLNYAGLSHAGHEDTRHSKNMGVSRDTMNVSIIRTMMTLSEDRGPLQRSGTRVAHINTLNYLYRYASASFSDTVIRNVGTSTYMGCDQPSAVNAGMPNEPNFTVQCTGNNPATLVYAEDNRCNETPAGGDWESVRDLSDGDITEAAEPTVPMDKHPTVLPSEDVETYFQSSGGARSTERDAIDSNMILTVSERRGIYIDRPVEAGGYDETNNTHTLEIPPNHDQDSGNGYTNLEIWVHGLAADLEQAAPVFTRPGEPVIDTQPINESVAAGGSVTISVDASWVGDGTPDLVYTWEMDGWQGDGPVPVPGAWARVQDMMESDISGQFTDTLSIDVADAADDGASLRCRIAGLVPGTDYVLTIPITLTVT